MKISFKKIFNWDICSVSEPVPVFDNGIRLHNIDKKLLGYNVTINYVHHGTRKVFFSEKSRRYNVIYGGARQAAKYFCYMISKKHNLLCNEKQK